MKQILVIEDNLEIRENISEILELGGYSVITAVNGREGVELAKQKMPHVILCDIMMPELNGYEVFQELKKDSVTSGISFVFVTASAEKSEVSKGIDMGANGYIRKPFEEQELFDAIERCLNCN